MDKKLDSVKSMLITNKSIMKHYTFFSYKIYPNQGQSEKCSIKVVGMTCASCVNNIEKNISKEAGVYSILVSLMSARADVIFDPNLTSPEKIAEAIDDMGFEGKFEIYKLTKN